MNNILKIKKIRKTILKKIKTSNKSIYKNTLYIRNPKLTNTNSFCKKKTIMTYISFN